MRPVHVYMQALSVRLCALATAYPQISDYVARTCSHAACLCARLMSVCLCAMIGECTRMHESTAHLHPFIYADTWNVWSREVSRSGGSKSRTSVLVTKMVNMKVSRKVDFEQTISDHINNIWVFVGFVSTSFQQLHYQYC